MRADGAFARKAVAECLRARVAGLAGRTVVEIAGASGYGVPCVKKHVRALRKLKRGDKQRVIICGWEKDDEVNDGRNLTPRYRFSRYHDDAERPPKKPTGESNREYRERHRARYNAAANARRGYKTSDPFTQMMKAL